MDLRSLKIHFVDQHVRLVAADHEGECARDLSAAAFVELASLAELRQALPPDVRAISFDAVEQVVRISRQSGAEVLRNGAAAEWFSRARPTLREVMSKCYPRSDDPADKHPGEPAFWQSLYEERKGNWELGRAAPPLVRWFRGHALKGKRALVVGCGRGHEARLLADLGAHAVGIDFAAHAIKEAKQLHGASKAEFVVADLFALPKALSGFDLIVEHTCFCAIDPSRRGDYVKVIRDRLAPGGKLVGLFYCHGRPGGPPFTTSHEEVKKLFSNGFFVEHEEVPRDSVPTRLSDEFLFVARRQ